MAADTSTSTELEVLRTEFRQRHPAEVLSEPPGALLGVSPAAATALERLDIHTVFDLATSSVFAAAASLMEAGTDLGGPLYRHGRPPADLIRESVAGATPLTELQFAAIDVLDGVPAEHADEIAAALDVSSVRELALYPPRRAARRLLDAAYFLENDPGFDPERPPDLLPRTGEYPTERVQYSTLFLDHVPEDGVLRDLTDPSSTPIDLAAMSRTGPGFTRAAFGALLTFTQSWYAQGVTLGQLLHSTSLAPGESTRVAVIDWTRASRAGETEQITEVDDLTNDQSHNRSISEVTKAVATEAQGGFSQSRTNSFSAQHGRSTAMEMSAPLGGLLGGPSGSMGTTSSQAVSAAQADSYSTSWGRRNLSSSMNQKINDRTHQHAHSSRSRRASVVKEVSQTEHESVSTRVLANYNHMHALTIQYYEVVQVYRVEVAVTRADRVVFVPVALIDFDDETIRRHRAVLAAAALDDRVREALSDLGTVTLAPAPKASFSVLGTSLELALATVLKTRTALGVFGPVPPGDPEVARPPAAAEAPASTVTPAAGVSKFTAWAAVQGLTAQLWSTDQVAQLSGMLNREVVQGRGAALHLPADVVLEGAAIEVGGSSVSLSITDREGRTVGSVSPDRPVPLSGIGSIGLTGSSPDRDLEAVVTLTVNRNGVRFPVRLPAVAVAKGTTARTEVVALKAAAVDVNLKQHLNDNRMHYSQAVYRSLDSTQIALLLAGHGVTLNGRTVPLAQVVEPMPVRYVGNYLAFAMNTDPADDPEFRTWLSDHGVELGATQADLVPLGSGGTFAEAVLGRSNCAEKLDITRFWNWQDSPIPLQPSDIAAIQTGSRAQAEDTSPGQLSTPIVNITTPTTLPDPVGTAAILSAIQNGAMFRDMSGLQATVGLAQAALQATASGAATAGQQAGENMNNLLKANTERQRVAAEMITKLADTAASMYTGGAAGGGGGGGISPASTSSEDGAKINYFDRTKGQDTPPAPAAPSSGGAVPATTGGSSGGGGPSSPGGGSPGGGSGGGPGAGSPAPSSGGYSRNPAALAATWGDGEPRSALANRIVDTAATVDRGREGSDASSFDYRVPGTVPAVAQPSSMTCWATVATMMVSWRDGASHSIQQVMDTAGAAYRAKFDADQGLQGSEKPAFLTSLGLRSEAPMAYSVSGLLSLLRAHGPLWVTTDEDPSALFAIHARIATGMFGDGTVDGTSVRITDPAGGREYTESFRDFMLKFEQVAGAGTLRVQVVHF